MLVDDTIAEAPALERAVPKGHGMRLGDIEAVANELDRRGLSDVTVYNLSTLIFDDGLPATSAIKDFRGFDLDDPEEISSRSRELASWPVTHLRSLCDLLKLPRDKGLSKTKLIETVWSFLAVPTGTPAANAAAHEVLEDTRSVRNKTTVKQKPSNDSLNTTSTSFPSSEASPPSPPPAATVAASTTVSAQQQQQQQQQQRSRKEKTTNADNVRSGLSNPIELILRAGEGREGQDARAQTAVASIIRPSTENEEMALEDGGGDGVGVLEDDEDNVDDDEDNGDDDMEDGVEEENDVLSMASATVTTTTKEEEAGADSSTVSDEQLLYQVKVILASCDLSRLSNNIVRQKLEEHFAEEMSARMDLIRACVEHLLAPPPTISSSS